MKNIRLATEALYDNYFWNDFSYFMRYRRSMFIIIHVKYRCDNLYFLDEIIKFNVIYEKN